MVTRMIELKFRAECQRCGAVLTEGVRATWDSATRKVACVVCPPAAESAEPKPSQSTTRSRGVSPPEQSAGDTGPSHSGWTDWRRLLEFELSAVKREAAPEPVAAARDHRRWVEMPDGPELLITGRADTLALSSAASGLFDAAEDDAVYYGWPTVVLADRTGRLRVAPLVHVELEASSADAPDEAVAATEPTLNAGLLTETFFGPDILADFDRRVQAELPFGDAVAMWTRIDEMRRILGFESLALDPDVLSADGGGPGVHNRAMMFRGKSSTATRALVEELTELRMRTDWHGTAVRWLMESPSARSADSTAIDFARPDTSEPLLDGLPLPGVGPRALNDSQERAAADADVAPLTVVTGPPGTGKSELVVAVVAGQWLTGRGTLISSTNNPAVKVAVERCNQVDAALLIRTGNAEHRNELPRILRSITSRPSAPAVSRDVMRSLLEHAARSRSQLIDELELRSAAEFALAQCLVDREVIQRLIWKSSNALPSDLTRERLHGLARKARRSRWFRSYRRRRIVEWASPSGASVGADEIMTWADKDRSILELRSTLARMRPADADADTAAVNESARASSEAGTAALKWIVDSSIGRGRAAIEQLAGLRPAALGARMRAIEKALPFTRGWACTTLSARANFPLAAGIFDLLIIDEASQCSVAAVIPLAYRARRILIVGDPNQLAPIVTLRKPAVDALASAHGYARGYLEDQSLSFDKDSAFTAFAARACVTHLLDEHHRCHPQIAQFFNREFYDNSLTVLSEVNSTLLRGISVIDVVGHTERTDGGSSLNRAEASAIARWISEHPEEHGHIGVVTPFSAQADLIGRELEEVLGSGAYAAAGIVIGTAHRFQGGEREVMLFSTVLATDVSSRTVSWVEEKRNLINVAVSRARRALVVFTHTQTIESLPLPTLQALLACAGWQTLPRPHADEGLHEFAGLHSEAERRIFSALTRRGIHPELKPVVEGHELDLAIRSAAGPVDVEIDGTQHLDVRGRQRRQDLSRDQIVWGVGWRVIRIPAWRCIDDADGAADDVVRMVASDR